MCPFTQNSIWQIVEAQAQQGKDTHSIFDIIGKEIQAKIVEHDRCLAFHDFPLQSGRASVSFLKMEGKKAFSSISEDGFDPSTSGLWAQHASAAPLCCPLEGGLLVM
uniref:Uncharacterized protein n=1 Tax=Sus scrofa TaxID=9823 RepID=A0A8D1T4Q4_PIG